MTVLQKRRFKIVHDGTEQLLSDEIEDDFFENEDDFAGDPNEKKETDDPNEKKETIVVETTRLILKEENAVRLKKIYREIEINVDGEAREILREAQAMIEKSQNRFQIWVSVFGEPVARCELMNEIVEWFEDHQLIKQGDPNSFSVCIPHGVGFRSSNDFTTGFLISVKQPI